VRIEGGSQIEVRGAASAIELQKGESHFSVQGCYLKAYLGGSECTAWQNFSDELVPPPPVSTTSTTGGVVIGGQHIPPGTKIDPVGHGGVQVPHPPGDVFLPKGAESKPMPPTKTVTVLLPVEVYSAPRGPEKKRLTPDLAAGTAGVTLLQNDQEDPNWYQLKWADRMGWVWSGPEYISLKF
jgi:hypothetical protein